MIERFLSAYMRKASRRYMSLDLEDSPLPIESRAGKEYLLYLHIPFCETLCPYCSFYRTTFEQEPAHRYYDSLLEEIRIYAAAGFHFGVAYIGGGTPTVLPVRLAEIIDLIRSLWSVHYISVETHPHHLTDDTMGILKDSGVDRLSVGVQTFNKELLQRIKRRSDTISTDDVKHGLRTAQDRFATVNVDMMFNFPDQSLSMVLEDVEIVRDLGMNQVTFYPLMNPDPSDTQTYPDKPDQSREKIFYRRIVKELSKMYRLTTAWSLSRRDGLIDEYIVDYDEYAGLGAGAFGFLNGIIYSNVFDVGKYTTQINQGTMSIAASKRFSTLNQIRYDFLMKLFGTSVSLDFFREKYGRLYWLFLWKEITFFLLAGITVMKSRHLKLIPARAYCIVSLMREFFTGVNRLRSIKSREE